MMTDDDLRANVTAELLWDPKVHSGNIAVIAERGSVMLTGAVTSLRQKRVEAQRPARRR